MIKFCRSLFIILLLFGTFVLAGCDSGDGGSDLVFDGGGGTVTGTSGTGTSGNGTSGTGTSGTGTSGTGTSGTGTSGTGTSGTGTSGTGTSGTGTSGTGTSGTGTSGTGTSGGPVLVPTSLRFVTPPNGGLAGVAFDPAVQVEVLDQNGDRLSTNALITLFLATNPTGANLSGNTAAAVNGLATFENLVVSRTGGGFTLSALGAGLSLTSAPFSVDLLSEQFAMTRNSTVWAASPILGQGSGNTQTRSIASGDFDGDGRPDVATLIGNHDVVRVHFRQPDGSFQPYDRFLSLSGNSTPLTQLVAGRVNDDAVDDLIVFQRPNAAAGSKTVFLSNANRTFATGLTSDAPINVNDVVARDLNGDDRVELIMASEGTGNSGTPPENQLTIWHNTNAGDFYADTANLVIPGISAGNADPRGVAVGDFNNNGLFDIVVSTAGFNTNNVQIRFDYNFATPGFPAAATVLSASGTPMNMVRLANLDNANGQDFVVPTTNAGINLFSNTGTGTFTVANRANSSEYTTASSGNQQVVAVANFDPSDDSDEMLICNNTSAASNVRYIANAGDPAAPSLAINVPETPTALAVADFSGDGRLDVAILNRSSSGVSTSYPLMTAMLSAAGTSTGFSPSYLRAVDGVGAPESSAVQNPVVADVNGDGFADLISPISTGFGGIDEVQIWLGNNAGTFPAAPQIRQTTVGGSAPANDATLPLDVAVADLDGDTDADLVIADNGSSLAMGLRFFLNDGSSTPLFSEASADVLSLSGPQQVLAAQLDSDAALELAVRLADSSVVIVNGTFPYSASETTTYTNTLASDLTTAFLDADNVLDLVASAGSGILTMTNDGNGTFSTQLVLGPSLLVPVAASISAGDIDGNGLDDAVVTQGNLFHIFYSSGSGVFDIGTLIAPELKTSTGFGVGTSVGDLNGDGLGDLIVTGSETSSVGVFLSQGNHVLRKIGFFLTGLVGRLTLADLDNDGLADILSGAKSGNRGLYPILQQASP